MNLSFNFLGTSESGELSSYKDRFSGFYTPRGMFGSPDAYYYGADHEAYETAASYKTEINYNFNSSSINENDYNFRLSGDFFGVRSGEIGLSVPRFSGSQASGLLDSPALNVLFSGGFSSYGDSSIFQTLLRGSFSNSMPDNSNFLIPSISGDLISSLLDLPTISNIISGSLYRFEKDDASLGILISGISFSRGHVKERVYLTGNCGLGVTLGGIWFSRAGG